MSLFIASASQVLQGLGASIVEATDSLLGGTVQRFCQMDVSHQVIASLALIVLSYVCLQAFSRPRP